MVRTAAGAGHPMFATPLHAGLSPASSVAFPGRTFRFLNGHHVISGI